MNTDLNFTFIVIKVHNNALLVIQMHILGCQPEPLKYPILLVTPTLLLNSIEKLYIRSLTTFFVLLTIFRRCFMIS